MNAPSEDIKDILDGDSALGLTFKTDLFVEEQIDKPNATITVRDSGGPQPQYHMPVDTIFKPTVQIMARGTAGGYLVAHELLQDIRATLEALSNYTINGARYLGFWTDGDIISVGLDESKRPLLSLNLRMERTAA